MDLAGQWKQLCFSEPGRSPYQQANSEQCRDKENPEKSGYYHPDQYKGHQGIIYHQRIGQERTASFIQKQVGHATTRMIVDHYYRYTPASDDGSRLEKAWNSTRILPESDGSDFEMPDKIRK